MTAEEAPPIEEPEVVESTAEEVPADFSFTVIKHGDTINVNAQGDGVTVDDIYATVCILKRNIEAEQTAAMVQRATLQAFSQVQQQAEGVRESGLVVPK